MCKDNDEMSVYSDDNDDNVLLINKVSISLKTIYLFCPAKPIVLSTSHKYIMYNIHLIYLIPVESFL